MDTALSLASMKSRGIYLYVITFLYCLAAASTVDVFMTKWTTVVDHPQYSLEKIVTGTEPKPYAFRLLMPFIVNKTFDYLPEGIQPLILYRAHLAIHRYLYEYELQASSWSDALVIKYGLSGAWFFIFLTATLLVLRKVAERVSPSRLLCDVGPIVFALTLPLSFRATGGFVYDFLELFLFSLYLWFVLTERYSSALLLLPLAVFNKETAILWPLLILFPFTYVMARRIALRVTVLHFTLVSILSLGIYWFLREVKGSHTEFHFVKNLWFWLDPRTYLIGLTTGLPLVPFPKPQHVILLPFLMILFFAYWSKRPLWLQLATAIGVAILLPLFVLFSYRDEYRACGLLFPVLFLNGMHTVYCFLAKFETTIKPGTETVKM